MTDQILLAGVDGGGTKTECLVCAADGRVLGHGAGGASNPNGQPRETAAAALCAAVGQALSGLEGRVFLFAGIAGCSSPEHSAFMRAALESNVPGVRAAVDSDTRIALSAAIGPERDGVVAISGTGSSCFARRAGRMLRVGGWGYLFGDMGSGFELGRMALMRAMRERDGLAEASALSVLVEERLGGPVPERLAALYEGGRTYIASFARCVGEALARGDAAAEAIVRKNARGMAERVAAALRLTGSPDAPVALAGTLWKALPAYRERVAALLPGRTLLDEARPPVAGAVLEAAVLADIPVSEAFLRALEASPSRP